MDDGTAHAFGRVEGKLDRVDGKLDRITERVAEHGVRIEHVEQDVEELKNHRTANHRQGWSTLSALTVGLCVAVVSIGGSALVALLIK